ncbi:MAG TPA: arginine--tRNA ligase [Phycisphaerales bacterium]|nr:arginine--tRNA ligase [Phycisphaerales bacterium]
MANFEDPALVLRERFVAAIRKAFPELSGPVDPAISVSRQPQFGDFQSNAAMGLAKATGQKPRDIAARIIAAADIADIAEPLTEKSIAGPGFINISLRGDALAAGLEAMAGASGLSALGVQPAAAPETVVVDLCGVNLAKQMHVGHLRSTVIPDAIARTLERLGNKVVRQSHVGDWGLPIAMVTSRLMDELAAGRLTREGLTLDVLEKLYRGAQAACERDMAGLAAVRKYGLGPKLEAELEAQVETATEAFLRARDVLLKLQSHDPATYDVWKLIYDVTMRACLATCARLKANITNEHTAGESSYAQELAPLVQDLIDRKVAEQDQGAIIVKVDGFEVPCLVRKSDGGFLYATTDMAAIRRRVQKLGASRVVYGVDIRQSLHFKLVFGASIKAGYASLPDGRAARLEHAAFGTVLGTDGKPFKTRSGDNVKLSDLLDEAVQRARTAVDAALDRAAKPEGENAENEAQTISRAERESIAEAVGIAAIKYVDLSTERTKDYVFDFDRMLAFEGNTGPYLLYAYARIRAIFRKATAAGKAEGWETAPIVITEPAEKALALLLLRYGKTLQGVADSLEPHRMCQYLFELCAAFSVFYDQCKVLWAPDDATRRSRLALCNLTGRVVADGLSTLGIPYVERM